MSTPDTDLADVDQIGDGTMTAIGLYVIIATAGHDTTSFAMAGGVDALARFPDQFDRLRSEPDLVENAAYEVVRLTSPVRHFLRYAQDEAEVAGHTFAAGDRILLSYPGANRDPGLFDDPHSLDVGRSNASRQIGWGHGPQFCLGSRLGAHRGLRRTRRSAPRVHLDRADRSDRVDQVALRRRRQARPGSMHELTIDADLVATGELVLFSPAPSMYGGTDETRRNLLSERVLGLATGPR